MDRGTGIIGFGKTGRAVLDFLVKRGKERNIVVFDDMLKEKIELEGKSFPKNISVIRNINDINKLFNLKKVIISPGVNGRDKKFDGLRRSGVKIISEIEFAAEFISSPIVAVTGSNGKSTTVNLIHHFLKTSGKNSVLAGNIGIPLISVVNKLKNDSIVVLEVSSFQLEEIKNFKPFISVLLNITPDHLDRYKDFNDYVKAKLNILLNQNEEDLTVLNFRDNLLKEKFLDNSDPGGPAKIWFPVKNEGFERFAFAENSKIVIKLLNEVNEISLENNPLLGTHNVENIMAASLVALLFGVGAEDIEESLKYFKGLPHRMEEAGRLGPVIFVNDSKATNIDATLKAVSGINDNIVIILGGKDKGGDFSVFKRFIGKKVKRVLLIGDASEKIADQLQEKREYLIRIANLEEGISRGYEFLKDSGGAVLLSPGCASFDMFTNFEERGDEFKRGVKEFIGSIKNG